MTTFIIIDNMETAFWEVVNEETGAVIAETRNFMEAQRIRDAKEEEAQ